MVIAIIVIALAIFGIGLLLNKMSRANIFTVLAILCVLPWAKQLVALIVLFPYHSVSRERTRRQRSAFRQWAAGCEAVYGSCDHFSGEGDESGFCGCGSGHVIALVGKSGQE